MGKCVRLTAIKEDTGDTYDLNAEARLAQKQRFRCWIFENGPAITEMVKDCDFEIFDQLWAEIVNVLSLDLSQNSD